MSEQWMSIVEYARAYSVSDMTVRRRIKNGKLEAVLRDGKYYIPVQSGAKTVEPEAVPVASTPTPAPKPEMVVVKSHPSAQKTWPTMQTSYGSQPEPVRPTPGISPESAPNLPRTLTESIINSKQVNVEASALIAFCEAAIKKTNESERKTIDRFKAKLESLESQISEKNMEISTLRQQVEDLQVLVKILEKK